MKAAVIHLENDHSSYSNIFRRVVDKIGKPNDEIESTIETASNIEVSRVSKHLGYLGLIAGIAPMLGFIGTISGIIKIFYNISLTDNISIGIYLRGIVRKDDFQRNRTYCRYYCIYRLSYTEYED